MGSVQLTLTDGARVLPTTVRYPALTAGSGAVPLRRGGPFPLIVFSQGYAIAPEAYSALLGDWAADGYVVADPAYPFTTPGDAGGLNENDIVNHPADLQAVISDLVGLATSHSGTLSGLIDTTHIGVAGHSDGGDVTDAVAENSRWRDTRVSAAEVLSGAELASFGGSYSTTPGVPILVVQGTDDDINVPACSEQVYNQAPQPRYYLSLLGAGHHSPYLASGPYQASQSAAQGYEKEVVQESTDFWNGYLKGDSAALAALRAGGGVAGVSTLTAGPAVAQQGSCPGAPAG